MEDEDISDDGKNTIKILYSNDVCCVCNNGDNSILVCTKCDNKYHLKCLNPPKKRRPLNNWNCSKCMSVSSSTSSSSDDSEIQDGVDEPVVRRSGRLKAAIVTENDEDGVRQNLRRNLKPVYRFVAGSASRKRRRGSSANDSDGDSFEKTDNFEQTDRSSVNNCSIKVNKVRFTRPESNLNGSNLNLNKLPSTDGKISLWKTESAVAGDNEEDYCLVQKIQRKRKQYGSEQLKLAIDAVVAGEMNVNMASKLFKIPRSSIGKRLRMQTVKTKKPVQRHFVEEDCEIIIRVEDLD